VGWKIRSSSNGPRQQSVEDVQVSQDDKVLTIKRVVTVWDEKYEVTVLQKSKSVWIASGEYMGKSLQVQGRTAGNAIDLWRDAARFRGNNGF
jgi:hypothetical protein